MLARTPRPRPVVAWSLPAAPLALLALTLAAPEARASGLSTARFGGEHGHPTTDNPTAIYYNPAGIALKPGTRIFLDASIAARFASYARPDSAVSSPGTGTPDMALDANVGTAKLANVIAGPFAGVSSDFGTKFFSGGLALYYPFGGQARWNTNDKYAGNDMYPGAVDGVQRWYTIDGKIRSMYLTGAVAFNIAKIGLSIGLSGSAIRSEVDTIRARNADGTDDLVNSDNTLKEGRSWLKASGWQGSFGIGLIWQWRDKLWIGGSYTSRPNITGDMTLKGELHNALATAKPDITQIELTQRLPDVARLGFRFRPTPKVELRLFGDFTNWKVFDKQCVLVASVEGRNCGFDNADTALTDPENFGTKGTNKGVTQHLPRFWKPAGGVRVGASYWVVDPVELFAGVGFDSSAVPVQTLDSALMDSNKMTFSLGGRFEVHKNVALAVTFTDVAYFKVDTKGRSVLNKFTPPTRQGSAEGVYKHNIFLTNIYLDLKF